MKPPSLRTLDYTRSRGLRPQMLACIVKDYKILFLYSKKHHIWGFAQGGVDNKEVFYDAVKRELREELGETFTSACRIARTGVFGRSQIIFPKRVHNSKELATDAGKDVDMIGKKYFYVLLFAKTRYLRLQDSEFQRYKWVNYAQAKKLIEKIYQPGKQNMTEEVLDMLYESDVIS